ncbi:MAG TPA: pyridoxal-phosphate dependent enzyme [Solirubrobacteraceae bacterium]|jgi:threonine dehydratase
MPTDAALTLDDIRAAARRIEGVAHRTPVLRSRGVDDRAGADVHLKAESFQRIGAFKFRGAYNCVSQLDAPAGVVASSSGNHAQAVALAARLTGTHAVILMPTDAPASKRAATEALGAKVIEFDRYGDDREALTREVADRRGYALVHAYDDPRIMAGAGTTALELVEEVPGLDVLVVPLGGGGLISGCAVAAKALVPGIRVVGVEPEASDDGRRSLASGERVRVAVGRTIADGQQLPQLGALTFPVIREHVDTIVTVGDEEIVDAMGLLFERVKVVAEPSGASALAAVLAGKADVAGLRVGVVLSGGNIDRARFAALCGAAQT